MNKEENYAISFFPLKYIGFYQMVYPNSPKMFGYYNSHMIHIFLIMLTTIVTVIGLTGFVYNNDEPLKNEFQYMQIYFTSTFQMFANIKSIMIICNADEVWKTFFVANETILSNKYCKKNRWKIMNSKEYSRRTLILYVFVFFMTAMFWILLSIFLNVVEPATNKYIRKINIFNLKYPIKVETYNKYYSVVYIIEAILCFYCAFGLVAFDVFILAELQLISTQFEILSSAYEDSVNIDENEDVAKFSIRNIENKLLSITSDCQNIYKNLVTMCKISRPILFINMVGDSIGMITLPYIIAMCYVESGSLIVNSYIFTFLWTLFNFGLHLYMFCSLFQLVGDNKESLSFGLYSCDWTSLDITFKKRMLLAMRMHSTMNRKIMNVSPTKYMGLPMLAAIVQLSYKITSVMINSNILKSK